MGDLRPSMASALSAFGLPVILTRPTPDNTPVTTTGIWLPPLQEERMFGTDFQRRDPRAVMAVARTASLTNAPRGTLVTAPELDGGPPLTWRVDGYDTPVEVDHMRLILIQTAGD